MFVDSSITVLENSSIVTVQLMRSNPIRQNVTVRVLGGEEYVISFSYKWMGRFFLLSNSFFANIFSLVLVGYI